MGIFFNLYCKSYDQEYLSNRSGIDTFFDKEYLGISRIN